MDFQILPGEALNLKTFPRNVTDAELTRKKAKKRLESNIERMRQLQDMMFAHNRYSLLIVFQAMDTAGKDGAIKHVMSGLNPQGTQVKSFKKPSEEELQHDYLWRCNKHLPERGNIGIFNRSYYEEVLVVRVHNLIKNQFIPEKLVSDGIWEQRYRQIRDYEQYLTENGTVILKFFLHISREEQKDRLLARINNKSKNWKFSQADIEERRYWDKYQECYEDAIKATSTANAPWFIIPSNQKWFARLAISEIIINKLDSLGLAYPELDQGKIEELETWKKRLLAD